MEELIGLVSQKAGLSSDKAQTAVETVLGFLKGKLPAALSGQIDSAISGGGGGTDVAGLGEVTKGLGSLFGK